MNRLGSLVGLCLILLGMTGAVWGAPLFPDVPDAHWARDAVATLASKGLVEGYPDGTFKGDRAATRWEVALVVARLLARMEQEHATFATRAELEELRRLVAALRTELDALGVRVTALEEDVSRLDQRVTELERITFYGHVTARGGVQDFYNTGAGATVGPGGVVTVNYGTAVGSASGAGGPLGVSTQLPLAAGQSLTQYSFGVFPVTNWATGRPLTSGNALTMKGVLGVQVRLTEDLESGAEFVGFTSQGDAVVDAYYGTSAPYLSNLWTGSTSAAGGTAGVQPLNHLPFTRMTLDHFWLRHAPSDTTLIVGAFGATGFDGSVYSLEPNPNNFGPTYLDSFGIQVRGRVDLDAVSLDWEALGTRLADGNIDVLGGTGNSYFSHAEGVTLGLGFHDGRGEGRLNFLHAANDASAGAARVVGLINVPMFQLNWVNPNGFYFGQLGGVGTNTAGIGSTSDVRPVPTLTGIFPAGSDGITGTAGFPNYGGVGPQDQTSYGLSIDYTFESEFRPHLRGEWAQSQYRPQKNSSYSATGSAWRIGAGATFLDDSLDLGVEYLRVDPTFDPFLLQFPQVAGISSVLWRVPDFNQLPGLYSLHDTRQLPHNRDGFRARLDWQFLPEGRLSLGYGSLSQTRTSLQDVRFSQNSIAPGTPNTPVLGFAPGFIDPVFAGLSPFTFVPSGGNLLATPLENPRGRVTNLHVGASHKWFLEEGGDRAVGLRADYEQSNFFRDSNLSALRPGLVAGTAVGVRGESVNFVDFTYRQWTIGVEYDVSSDFQVHGGYSEVAMFGHLDPYAIYSDYAQATGQTRFTNLDLTQRIPTLGFDWEVADNVTWGVDGSFFSVTDNVNPQVLPTPAVPGLNLSFGPQVAAHPFNWAGWQLMSEFSVKF